jgi:hypothetical protein
MTGLFRLSILFILFGLAFPAYSLRQHADKVLRLTYTGIRTLWDETVVLFSDHKAFWRGTAERPRLPYVALWASFGCGGLAVIATFHLIWMSFGGLSEREILYFKIWVGAAVACNLLAAFINHRIKSNIEALRNAVTHSDDVNKAALVQARVDTAAFNRARLNLVFRAKPGHKPDSSVLTKEEFMQRQKVRWKDHFSP